MSRTRKSRKCQTEVKKKENERRMKWRIRRRTSQTYAESYWLARLKRTLKVRSRLCESLSPA